MRVNNLVKLVGTVVVLGLVAAYDFGPKARLSVAAGPEATDDDAQSEPMWKPRTALAPASGGGPTAAPPESRARARAPVAAAASSQSVVQEQGDDDDIGQDEAIFAADQSPEQGVWRAAWARESQDAAWTQEVVGEVTRSAQSLLQGHLTLNGISCRETVCRMYVQFGDQADADAFIDAPHDQALHYEFQRLDPGSDGNDLDLSSPAYEVLIKREHPADRELQPADDDDTGTALAAIGNIVSATSTDGPAPSVEAMPAAGSGAAIGSKMDRRRAWGLPHAR